MSKRLKVAILAVAGTLAVVALGMASIRFYNYWQDLKVRASSRVVINTPPPVAATTASGNPGTVSVGRPTPTATAATNAPRKDKADKQYVLDLPFVKETVALNAGEGHYWSVGKVMAQRRLLNIQLQSTGPVDIGIIGTAVLSNQQLIAQISSQGWCGRPKVMSVKFMCIVPAPEKLRGTPLVIVVRDSRGGGTVLLGGVGALVRNQAAMDKAVARNDVSLTVTEHWDAAAINAAGRPRN